MKTGTWLPVALAALAGGAWAETARKGEPAHARTVLTKNAYWRHWYSFGPPRVSPDRLRAEGEEYIGTRGRRSFKRYQQDMQRRMKQMGVRGADWTDHAIVMESTTGFQFDTLKREIRARHYSAMPPGDWMRAGFDDASWARYRRCFSITPTIRRACLRARFFVPEPNRVKGLRFSADYRGGIRVFLNGKEIARGHLPEGRLAPETPAEEYPPEAYFAPKGDFYWLMDFGKVPYGTQYCITANGRPLVPELGRPFEKYPVLNVGRGWPKAVVEARKLNPAEAGNYRAVGGQNCNLNRACYDRVVRLRHRSLNDVAIDSGLLRRGENVLAVEVRPSDYHPIAVHWHKAYQGNPSWSHGDLRSLELKADAGIPSAVRPRPGVQVWVEDVHRRVHAPDFFPLPRSAHGARIVGCRNGSFGAQIALRTDRELTGISAGVDAFGGKSPVKARVLYSVPHRLSELEKGDGGRRVGNSPSFRVFADFMEVRYGSTDVPYFEHLSPEAPERLPADSGYVFWVSCRVPENAAAGKHKSVVRIKAAGMDPVEVPLEVEVVDWRVPDPEHFQTVMGLEQSPYSVARRYNTPLWSDAHFRILEKTFQYMAQVDLDWVNIPILSYTEFGNRTDSPCRIIRAADGRYAVDFTNFDKYMDLVIRHTGVPKVVSFTVMHAGNPGDGRMALSSMEVHVTDAATGRRFPLAVDHRAPEPDRRKFWKFLSTALHAHMQDRGLAESMYWGYTWDGVGTDPSLYGMLAEFVPGVFWSKGSHQQGLSHWNRAVATAYNSRIAIGFGSRKGWKWPDIWLAYPRYWGTIIDCSDYTQPFANRLMAERALTAGARGIGRVGVDYWDGTYLSGMRRHTYRVGVPNLFLLWPGPDGPETGTRFEILREGLQEAETRVFLEQALEKLTGETHQGLTARVGGVLKSRLTETLKDLPNATHPEYLALCTTGWQGRSRDLYRAAAEVAKVIGVDLSRTGIEADVPARGRKEVPVTVRNWTASPRAWRVSFEKGTAPLEGQGRPMGGYVVPGIPAAEWMGAEPSAGTAVAGQSPLKITLDGTRLEPGTRNVGVLRFTDAVSGRSEEVRIEARVGPVMTLKGIPGALNFTAGVTGKETFTLVNSSGEALSWTVAFHEGRATRPDPKNRRRRIPVPLGPEIPWLASTPRGGGLAPGATVLVEVGGTAPVTARPNQPITVTITESGGRKKQQELTLHVLKPYRQAGARPAGTPLPLESLGEAIVKSHSDGRRGRKARYGLWKPRDDKDEFKLGKAGNRFKGGLKVAARHETVFNIEGKGFRAFAAEVGPDAGLSSRINLAWAHEYRLSYEVYVDGKLAACSGLMEVTDSPRLLVARLPAAAKELRIVGRAHNDRNHRRIASCWAEPAFYK